MRNLGRALALLCLVSGGVPACSDVPVETTADTDVPVDTSTDAGTVDTGAPDTGTVEDTTIADTGTPDTGSMMSDATDASGEAGCAAGTFCADGKLCKAGACVACANDGECTAVHPSR